jgi:hypothetical protein
MPDEDVSAGLDALYLYSIMAGVQLWLNVLLQTG